MPPTSTPTPEAQEMNTALDQALTCTTCTHASPTPQTLSDAVSSGRYSLLRDPPFSSPRFPADGIPPAEQRAGARETGYKALMTERQRARYRELVPLAIGGTEDLKMAVLMGFYQVDYHVHVHYLFGRSVLALCRDVADVRALRRWRWGVAMAGSVGGARSNGGWTGWLGGDAEMLDQVSLWRRRWQERRERVDMARVRWVGIMEERRVQRMLAGMDDLV